MRILLAALALLLVDAVQAQDKMRADRPSETMVTETVSKNNFQLELGFDRQRDEDEALSLRLPDAVFRYGLFEKLELRMKATAEYFESSTEKLRGLQPLRLGLKAGLFQTQDNKFSLSVMAEAGFPNLASPDHDVNKVIYQARILLENQITEKFSLGYNFGTDQDSRDHRQVLVYTFSPQFELTPAWQIFLELFGHIRNYDHPDHNLNAGLAWLLGPNAQIDLSGAIGLTPHSPRYLFSAGLSFLLR